MHSRSSVLQGFLRFCSPAGSEQLGSAVRVDAEIYRGPEYPVAGLSRLLDEFTESELLAAGLGCQIDCDAELLPAPGWSNPGSLLVVLRDAAGEEPFDILSDRGALTGAPALLASVNDYATVAAFDPEQRFVLVAGSIHDLVTLRGAGLPATLTDGILPLDRRKLEELYSSQILRRRPTVSSDLADKLGEIRDDCRAAAHVRLGSDWLQAEGARAAAANPLELIFVAWSPADLSPAEPACLAPIREAFRALELHLRLDVSELFQWSPTAKELESFRFCLEFGEQERVQRLLRESIDRNCVAFVDDLPSEDSVRPGFETALAELQYAVTAFRRDSSQRGRVLTSLEGYYEAVERELLAPLRSQGLNSRSPMRRSLHFAAAEISRHVHRESYWARTAAELLGCKQEKQGRGPEVFFRAISALTNIAKRLLA